VQLPKRSSYAGQDQGVANIICGHRAISGKPSLASAVLETAMVLRAAEVPANFLESRILSGAVYHRLSSEDAQENVVAWLVRCVEAVRAVQLVGDTSRYFYELDDRRSSERRSRYASCRSDRNEVGGVYIV